MIYTPRNCGRLSGHLFNFYYRLEQLGGLLESLSLS